MAVLCLTGILTPPGSGQVDSVETDSFQSLAGRRATARFQPRDSLRARRLLDFLEGLPPLAGLPTDLPRGVSIFIAPDEFRFDSLVGGAVPEWGAAVAIPGLDRIVVPREGPRRVRGWTEARVLQHEWAHLGLHQFLPGLRVPRWFDEGYAEWASGGWTPTEGWRLRVAMAMGRTPPLDSLILDWPRGRAEAELAYLLSATAVEYLMAESGERGLRLFFSAWKEGSNFAEAFRTVYGVSPDQFEGDWKKYVKRRYGWLFVLSHSSIFWLSTALILLVLVRVRRGRDREGMARLRASEPPDQPAYWTEEEKGETMGGVRNHADGTSTERDR